MRVFLSEFVCGGGWPGGVPEGSLRAEGQAMLAALAADFARIAGCRVATTWDARLDPFPLDGIDVLLPSTPQEERVCFNRLAGECDASLVIAPEFHALLAERSAAIERVGRLLGPSSDVVRLCGDKLQLAQRLGASGVPVIPTGPLPSRPEWERLPFPVVIKPRHGAGAVNTLLVRSAEDLAAVHRSGFNPPDLPPDVWQPYVRGTPLSVSVMASADGELDVFPVGEQCIDLADANGLGARFSYRGGRIPAEACPVAGVVELVRRAVAEIGPGVRGYLGLDLIVSETGPVIAEINPRLTTSYVGYRALTDDNLAERLLGGAFDRTLEWRPGGVEFSPCGTVRLPVQ